MPGPATAQAPLATLGSVQDGKNPRRRATVPRRAWLVVGGAAAVVLVVGGAVTAITTGMFDTTPDNTAPATTPAPLTSSAIPAPVVHASGAVEDLRGVEGIDLDANTRADQNAPGVDISFAAQSNPPQRHGEQGDFHCPT